jgi:O-antigen ligase
MANSYSSEVRSIMWPIKFGVLGLLFIYIISSTKLKFYRSRNTPNYIYNLLFIFSVLGLISIATYDGRYAYLIQHNSGYGYKLLFGFLVVLLIATQLARFLSIPRNQAALYFALTHSAAIVTYSNLILFVLGINLGRGAGTLDGTGGIGRFSGWLDNPNTLGIILIGAFPLVLQAALNRSIRKRWISYESLLVVSMVLLLLLTGSRSGLLGMSVMGAIVLWGHSYKARLVSILLIFFGSMLFWFEISDKESIITMQQFQRQGPDILSGRTDSWELARRLIKQNPYLGYGMGAENKLVPAIMPMSSVHQGNNVHNSYLSLLISSGYFGSIPLITLLIIGIKQSFLNLSSKTIPRDDFTVLMTALFVGFFAHAIFESWIFSPGSVYGFLFWTACFWLLTKKRDKWD